MQEECLVRGIKILGGLDLLLFRVHRLALLLSLAEGLSTLAGLRDLKICIDSSASSSSMMNVDYVQWLAIIDEIVIATRVASARCSTDIKLMARVNSLLVNNDSSSSIGVTR